MTVDIIDGRVVGYRTPEEISADWGVSAMAVRAYIHRKLVPCLKIGRQDYILEGTPKPTQTYLRRTQKNAE